MNNYSKIHLKSLRIANDNNEDNNKPIPIDIKRDQALNTVKDILLGYIPPKAPPSLPHSNALKPHCIHGQQVVLRSLVREAARSRRIQTNQIWAFLRRQTGMKRLSELPPERYQQALKLLISECDPAWQK